MNLLKIAYKSIRQRSLASALTMVSVALGVMLMVAVLVIHGMIDRIFGQQEIGYDLIVGPKGSDLQLVLSSVYRISPPIENVPYKYYKELKNDPRVDVAIPIALGDNSDKGNFPIVGTLPVYFTTEYAPDKKFLIYWKEGQTGMKESLDAIIGSEVARQNDWKIGSTFKLIHSGVTDHVHDEVFTVVGIMKQTHTPNDKTVFVHLDAFYAIAEHGKPFPEAVKRLEDFFGKKYTPEEIEELRADPETRWEVTTIFIKTRRPPEDLDADVSPLTFMLQQDINKGYKALAVNPIDPMKRLMDVVVGNVRLAMMVLIGLIIVVSGVSIFVSIYNSMSDRKKEIAIMRALGARRTTVFSIILAESIVLCFSGGILGMLLGHGLVIELEYLLTVREMSMSVYLISTLDTKGREIAFVRDLLAGLGVPVCVVDVGCLGEPAIAADIQRADIFVAAGTTLEAVQDRGDRGEAIAYAAKGVAAVVAERHAQGEVTGVLGLGGSAGTTIATSAMRELPLGLPKLMVSTLASGQTRPYVGGKDILMLNSVVDISGINRISRKVLSQAARAMAGMVSFPEQTADDSESPGDRQIVAATMFGVTTPCVQHAQRILEQAGYEVLVFHATGNGGEAMEALIADGLIAGVLDITTTELADELVGGTLSAGPSRLTAASKRGVPQVVSVGATDMVNFGPPETVPEKFRDRLFYHHNPTVTLMRTTAEENAQLGAEIGRKVSAAIGPAAIALPLNGVSAIDCEGQPFHDLQARNALFEAIRNCSADVELIELQMHINDSEFAEAAAGRLIELMQSGPHE
eukprot:g8397.t1